MITCQQAIDHLCEFVEGSLKPELRAAIQKHVDNCECCPRLLESYTKTMGLCRRALMRGAPSDFAERLLHVLREKMDPSGKGQR